MLNSCRLRVVLVLVMQLVWVTDLTGCRRTPAARPDAAVLGAGAGERTDVVAPTALFEVDSTVSHIELQLHADGALAALGHTHVIVVRNLRGAVRLRQPVERTTLQFQFDATDLQVDDAAERAAAGAEFAAPLDEAARAGTREHMLGEQVLDAARFPNVTLRSLQVRGTGADLLVEVQVTLRGKSAVLQVPVHWHQDGNVLRGTGRFDFKQSALGLEPYSALLGALRVADLVAAQFEIVARRVP